MEFFSEPLREEISDHMFGPVISQVSAFNRFDHLLIHQLSQTVTVEVFAEEDVLFRGGETSTDFYFIEKGEVEVYHEASEHTLTVLAVRDMQANKHFGEMAFFTAQPRCAAARCLKYSQMLVLKREDMLALLTPLSQVAYDYVKALYLTRDYSKLGVQCYICLESTHLAVDCPTARINIDKERLKQRWLRFRRTQDTLLSPTLDLANFHRRERKRSHGKRYSLLNIKGQPGSAGLENLRDTVTKASTRTQRLLSDDARSGISETMGLLREEKSQQS